MADLEPLILYDPEFTVNTVSLMCAMSHIEITPDVSLVEVKTSCGVREYPGTIKWTLKATLYHTHDPQGTNEVLTAAVEAGVPVPFTVIPRAGQPISATNPEYTGDLIPQPFTPISGDVGDASSFDLEWSISGWGPVPVVNTTPPPLDEAAVAAAAARTTPAPT